MNPSLNKIAILASADLTSAEVGLRGIPNDDPAGSFSESVLEQLRDKTASLGIVEQGGVKIGFTVYKVEVFGEHRELVSIATKTDTTQPVRFEIEKLLLHIARLNNCQTIRQHTVRHGLVRNALDNGWHVAEIVLRRPVPSNEQS